MNNNFRLKPKLIDVNLLNKINKIYINKSGGNHFILDWIYKTLYPCFRDNLLFSLVVFGLVTYLLYRYFENIKKKNKIISNINDNKPIEVQLKKPINYNNVETMENTEKSNISNLSLSNELSEINSNSNQKNDDHSFNKDIERELKIGQDTNKQPKSNTRKAMMINKPQQHQQQQQQPQQQQQQQQQQQPQKPQQPQQPQSEEYISNSLLEPNMPFEILERNMNRMKGRSADGNVQPKCANYRIPTVNEPQALNTFSDNFYEF